MHASQKPSAFLRRRSFLIYVTVRFHGYGDGYVIFSAWERRESCVLSPTLQHGKLGGKCSWTSCFVSCCFLGKFMVVIFKVEGYVFSKFRRDDLSKSDGTVNLLSTSYLHYG